MRLPVALPTRTWPKAAAKYLFRLRVRPVREEDGIVTAFRDGTVTLRSNRRVEGFTNATQEIGYHGVRAGDLVIHSMDAFAGAIGVSDCDGKVSPVALTYEAVDGINARYYAYLFRTLALQGVITSLAKGIRERSTSFDHTIFGSMVVPVPSPESQQIIVDFLDAEASRTDSLIMAKRRMIELLEERWSTEARSMLNSEGPRWVPLKTVAGYREGPGILAVDFRDHGIPLLRIGNLMDDTVTLEGCGFLDPADVDTRWSHLAAHTGELLISGSATSGLPVVVPPEADGAIPYTGLIRLWPLDGRLNRDYLRFFLASRLFTDQIDRLKTGIGLQHWGPSHLAQVSLPLPNGNHQAAIVNRLLEVRRRSLRLDTILRSQIALLSERRQAFIAAAVTGRLMNMPALTA